MPEVGSVKYKVELDDSQLNQDISKTESTISSKLDAGSLGKSLGSAIFKGVGSMAIQAGQQMIGFASDSIQAGATFDSSMSQVAATMGVTVDEVGNLRDFAQKMGATTAFSASQAADALNYMALAGYDADKSMEMLPTVLDLAAAGGIDLARASDMVTDAASALGLSSEDTAAMVDKMAQASSKSNTSVAQLGDAILTVGGTAKGLAGGTTELSTALGIMADSGIKGSEAGTHMRNILLALNPTTDKAKEAFEELGINAYDADGNLKPLNETFEELAGALSGYTEKGQSELLSNMFNKTDLAAVDALLTAATYDLDSMVVSLENSGINWASYTSLTTGAAVSTGDVASMIQACISQGIEEEAILKRLGTFYGLNAEDAIKAFDIVAAGMEDQGTRWTELSGYIDDAAGSAEKMADTQLDNLNGDITLMQSALEGVQIAISDALTPTLREFVQFGSGALSDLATAFKEGGLSGAVDAFGKILSEGITLILSKAPDLVSAGYELILSLASGLVDNLPEILDAALQTMMALVDGLIENIPKLIDTSLKIINALAKFIINNADTIVQKGVELIAALVKGLIMAIPDIVRSIPTIIQAIVKAFASFNWLSIGIDIIKGIAKGIGDAAGEIAEAAKDAARNALNKAKEFLGINSPSKVAARQIGEPYSAGVAKGIDDGMDEIDESLGLMERSLTAGVDLPDMSKYTGDMSAAISATASTQVTVPVMLDGREIARGTAWFMNEQLAWEAR